MFKNRNILFWCIDPSLNPMDYFTVAQINDCNYFIPVYCFDEGVKDILSQPGEIQRFNLDTVEKVDRLRERLRKHRSDLLIISGNSDKIIPSLARVLQTGEVYTVWDTSYQKKNEKSPFIQFFEKRIAKTKELLNMHSINMHITGRSSAGVYDPQNVSFPPFPEIDPGSMPIELLGA